MAKLLRPEDARTWLTRRYRNAHRGWFQGSGEWPLRVPLGMPTEQDLGENLPAVRAWITAWQLWSGPGEADWTRLIAVLRWLFHNSQSGLYVRQLPIEGIDTKWIEKRTALIADMLAGLRGPLANADFFEACGLRRMPHRVRCLILCPELRSRLGGLRDVEAPLSEIKSLPVSPAISLIVENGEIGVALPDIPGVIALIRLGNATSALAAIPWLKSTQSLYWGDIDTHGLAILSRARRLLPAVRSVLMDKATLLEYRSLWSEEPLQHQDAEFLELTTEERRLFADLRENKWGPRVRLEQERLPWQSSLGALLQAVEQAYSAAITSR